MAISAAMVKALREKTGLPMMEVKQALTEADGDEAQAIEILRKKGAGKMMKMATREATEGRIACFYDADGKQAGLVELRCETAPVAGTDDFINLANTIARHVALTDNPTTETIRDVKVLEDPSKTLGDLVDDVFNRLRENMKIARVAKLSGNIGHYIHHNSQVGVLLETSGECSDELKADVCMHIAAMRPQCLDRNGVDQKELELQKAAFMEEVKDKPAQIIDKIVDGKLDRWYSEFVLLDQPFVKDDKQSVGQILKSVSPDLTVTAYHRFEVGGA